MARTMKVREIEKNPILALSVSEKDIEKYERVAKMYGNVAPAIVGQSGDGYRVIAGQARLEACAKNGIREMPVSIAEICGEPEQMKLALLLSTVKDDGCPLSEGAFIDALITNHDIPRRELMDLLNKSKSWISRRQSLVLRLSEKVRDMVKDGAICARTAEEIAKLPTDIQFPFACMATRDGLSKTNVGQLVGIYRSEGTGNALREAILNNPLTVLDSFAVTKISRRKEKRGLSERIAATTGLLIRLSDELSGMLAIADAKSLSRARAELCRLRTATVDLKTILDGWRISVSPGQLKEGGTQ